MAGQRHISVSDYGNVTVVRFVDRKIIDASSIVELGEELFSLVEKDHHDKLLLNFADVEFLSSAALNKLILLDKKVKEIQGALKLCKLRPEINEVFMITRLNQLFDIRDSETEGLQAFS